MTRVFSGIQPTGEVHLGNYVGAMRHYVSDQHHHDSVYCVVDLHAVTVDQDPEVLRERTIQMATLLLAVGLDPQVCTLFVQSHVPAHTQLAWLLECTASVGELRRMTQFKEKTASGGEGAARAGLFTYPVLMAADILLYDTDRVPVGDDQRQHLELTRDLAERFNARYGPTFTVPAAAISGVGARIMDLQEPTSKMSKSRSSPQGKVLVLEDLGSVAKKIKRAVTDSSGEVRAAADKPAVTNLLTIHSALSGSTVAELEERFSGSGYGDLKKELAEVVVDFVTPVRQRTQELLDDPAELERTLARGAARAREVAARTVADAYDKVGFLPPAGAPA